MALPHKWATPGPPKRLPDMRRSVHGAGGVWFAEFSELADAHDAAGQDGTNSWPWSKTPSQSRLSARSRKSTPSWRSTRSVDGDCNQRWAPLLPLGQNPCHITPAVQNADYFEGPAFRAVHDQVGVHGEESHLSRSRCASSSSSGMPSPRFSSSIPLRIFASTTWRLAINHSSRSCKT